MKAFGNALLATPYDEAGDQTDGVSGYLRQVNLDLSQPYFLPDRPESFVADEYYQYFEYTLPQEFINAGNPQLKSYKAWGDSNGVKAMQFTFSNGQAEQTTPFFGNETLTGLLSKTINLVDPVMSVQTMMINKVGSTGQSVWGVVNFKINDNASTMVGPAAPSTASLASLERFNLSNPILPS